MIKPVGRLVRRPRWALLYIAVLLLAVFMAPPPLSYVGLVLGGVGFVAAVFDL